MIKMKPSNWEVWSKNSKKPKIVVVLKDQHEFSFTRKQWEAFQDVIAEYFENMDSVEEVEEGETTNYRFYPW